MDGKPVKQVKGGKHMAEGFVLVWRGGKDLKNGEGSGRALTGGR